MHGQNSLHLLLCAVLFIAPKFIRLGQLKVCLVGYLTLESEMMQKTFNITNNNERRRFNNSCKYLIILMIGLKVLDSLK